MKKTMILITVLTMMSFTLQTNNDKLLKVELSQSRWTTHFQRLNDVKNYINSTNLPHQDVKNIVNSIDSLLIDLSAQLIPQIDSAKRKR